MDREALGKFVRGVWIDYCLEIGDEKPSHIEPWSKMNERDKEADRRIGEAVWFAALDGDRNAASQLAQQRAICAELVKACYAAHHALLSYAYGNSATALARGVAEELAAALAQAGKPI